MLNAIRAEQIKLTTLRSTWWSIAVAIGISLGIAILIAANASGRPEDAIDIISVLFLAASLIALIAVMAMAVIVATGEYRFGQIRMTLAATPHRWQVMVAKALVTSGVAFAVGAVTAWLCVLLAGPLLPAGWEIDLSADGVLRVVWGLPLFFAAAALLALSLGALLRNSPAAITILALLSLAVEKTLLGFEKTRTFAQYLPFNAGARITQPEDGVDVVLSPWAGFWLFCVYALGLFLVAVLVTERRDA
jgi:ABC-2 type transport system permease protein